MDAAAPVTGALRWSTKVAGTLQPQEDFDVGGFIGSTATGGGDVFGATALGGAPWFHAGPISSAPAIVGDHVFIGSGTASSDLCAKDLPGSEACFLAFDETLGATGGVHAFRLA